MFFSIRSFIGIQSALRITFTMLTVILITTSAGFTFKTIFHSNFLEMVALSVIVSCVELIVIALLNKEEFYYIWRSFIARHEKQNSSSDTA